MDDSIPSISTGAVGSRFVSQNEIDTAKARRDEQWKAAYARLGQEPPPQPVEDVFDGRSLAEAAKQEEWEERNKLGNQFRALEEDEVLFLDSVLEKQREEERLREEMDGEELKNFRQAVAARENAAKPPPVNTEPISTPTSKPKLPGSSQTTKKDAKKSLKGVLVKKKAKPLVTATKTTSMSGDVTFTEKAVKSQPLKEGGDEPQAKRRKVGSSDSS
ncbi:N-terminal domain of NEFA-interacting nuclear protein NIP30-domain-containing protein [Irpex rosettiformis]|uniref:N-terminal domain of NEFA-interacting nuclear protein NIP30-domain-containing protein n=1 Tax=Irpex rosettiformis TaxID=378272 RepID=A0ACB8UKV2_9APHY|nr:N-terminal domain of NEFA-interacting nuclear protein NIP30-domain-containing protein [Irpex rosettiformis]